MLMDYRGLCTSPNLGRSWKIDLPRSTSQDHEPNNYQANPILKDYVLVNVTSSPGPGVQYISHCCPSVLLDSRLFILDCSWIGDSIVNIHNCFYDS